MSTLSIFGLVIGGLVILVALVVLVLNLVWNYQVKQNRISKEELEEFRKTHPKINLTEEQKRLLTFGAIYALMHENGRTVIPIEPTIKLEDEIEGNQEQWGVYNSDDAREVLADLLARKRTKTFDKNFDKEPDLIRHQKKIAEKLEIDISEVKKTTSTYAWDVCRAVNMARDFYFTNLIPADEMWEVMRNAVAEAERCGTSWTDYSVSFLLGRALHGFGMNDIWSCEELLKGKPAKIKDIDVYRKYSFK